MTNNKVITLVAICLLFALSAYSQESLLPKDTTESAGRGCRIVGYCLLGFALVCSVWGIYGYYKSKHDLNVTDVGTIFDEYPALLGEGLGLAIGSGISLTIGYHKEHNYHKWRNARAGSVSVSFEF
jgi:hypothetical protein